MLCSSITADFIHKIGLMEKMLSTFAHDRDGNAVKVNHIQYSRQIESTKEYWYIEYNINSIASHPPLISIFLVTVLMLRDVKNLLYSFTTSDIFVCDGILARVTILRMQKSIIFARIQVKMG